MLNCNASKCSDYNEFDCHEFPFLTSKQKMSIVDRNIKKLTKTPSFFEQIFTTLTSQPCVQWQNVNRPD